MVEPLWQELEALPGTGHHKKVILPGNHALDTARLNWPGWWNVIEEMVKEVKIHPPAADQDKK